MTAGSFQLRRFRVMIRDGIALEAAAAAAEVGMSIGEAQLTVQGDRRNPPGPECYEIFPHRASPAPEAQPKETTMAGRRRARQEAEQVEEVKGMDFARAVRLFKHDISPAQGKVGEFSQEMSTAYKEIKKHCGIQPQAARAAFKLADMEDDKRDDWLRCFYGLIEELGIGITEDLVDMSEQRQSAPEPDVAPIPRGPAPRVNNRKPKPLATVQTSDGSETDLRDAADEPHSSNVIGLNPNARAEILSTLN